MSDTTQRAATRKDVLPAAARSRLIALEVECAAARDTSQATQRRVDLLQKQMGYGQQASPEDIAAMNAELDQLRKVRGAQNEKYEQLAGLLAHIRGFFENLLRGAVLEMAPDIDTKPNDGETPLQAVERIRIAIDNTRRHLRTVAMAPLSPAFYKASARSFVLELAKLGRPKIDPKPDRLDVAFADHVTRVGLPVLAWLLPEVLISSLEAEVDALNLAHNEMTVASRERHIEEGRGALLKT